MASAAEIIASFNASAEVLTAAADVSTAASATGTPPKEYKAKKLNITRRKPEDVAAATETKAPETATVEKKQSKLELFKELGNFNTATNSTRVVNKSEFTGKYAHLNFNNGGDWCRQTVIL
jgi:hypothetical protein